jgi:prephenate dehydrogenase
MSWVLGEANLLFYRIMETPPKTPPCLPPELRRIVVIGPGLLGGSVGLGLVAAGYRGELVGVSRRPGTLDAAVAAGCIHRGTTDLAAGVEAADLIILATPLGTFPAILAQLASCLPHNAVVTDVGSTKGSVLAAARAALLPAQYSRFVGSHPMAGNEKQGPEAATPDLFHGKPCVIATEPGTDPRALALVRSLWCVLGMRLLHMTADEHDQYTAVISHLPHIASVLLALVAQDRGGTQIASTGFRDTTRLASSNPVVRADILLNNRSAVLDAIDAMAGRLSELRASLESADGPSLLATLTAAKAFRDRWLAEFNPTDSRRSDSDPGDV